jgi:uncharacterized membrane protein YccF (DUF307 family)
LRQCGTVDEVKTVLNVVWLIFGGALMALGYAIVGLICYALVLTIPFGVACFRLANFALWPFGRTVVPKPDAGGGSLVGNIIWVILAGWWLALGHIVAAVGLAITIIGIPLAWAHLKMVPAALFPLGQQVLDNEQAKQALRSEPSDPS